MTTKHLKNLQTILQEKNTTCWNLAQISLVYFCDNFIILPEGKFTFNNRKFLYQIYEDKSEHIVIEKSAQMGITTYALLKVLHACKFIFDKGAIYYFPTKTDVQDFSRSRVAPLIENCPILKPSTIETDNVGIKQIGNVFLYLRGMESTIGLKAVPADCLVFDELDECNQQKEQLALERISASRFKWIIELSNPSIPNYGVDVSFQKSDQHYWNLICSYCGTYNCLEDEFPNCLLETTTEEVLRVCKKCKRELDINKGIWIAKKPDNKIRGYHLSQLFSPTINPALILKEYKEMRYPQIFWNMKIGKPYVEAENKLEKQEILNRCDNYSIQFNSEEKCTMGIDVGKELYVVISQPYLGKRKIIYAGIKKEWYELDELMNNFKIKKCVVDALPEQRNARDFCKRHRGKAFMNFYSEHKKGDVTWNEEEQIVQEDRTESLDNAISRLRKGEVILPHRSEIVELFAEHCSNVAKKLEDDDKGDKRYIYVQLGDDHFLHAFNYDCLCWKLEEKIITPIGFQISRGSYVESLAEYDRNIY